MAAAGPGGPEPAAPAGGGGGGGGEGEDPVQRVLDLTNEKRESLEGVAVAATLEEVDLTGNRLAGVQADRLAGLAGLESLSFRNNQIKDFAEVATFAGAGTLRELIVSDNQVAEVPENVRELAALETLDLSYNLLRSLGTLTARPPKLTTLYAASNKIVGLEGLPLLAGLEKLDLGCNRIRDCAAVNALPRLEELWLGKNKIVTVPTLELPRLTKLSIQSNRLTSIHGLELCTRLEELYLSHQGIEAIANLGPLTRLKVLDLSNNRIAAVEGLETLAELEDLWLNDNRIGDLGGTARALEAGPKQSLDTVYFEGNPIAKDPTYRLTLSAALPNLKQLDTQMVKR